MSDFDCFDYDADKYGIPLGNVTALSVGNCGFKCILALICQYFAYNATSHTCYLKGATTTRYSSPGMSVEY